MAATNTHTEKTLNAHLWRLLEATVLWKSFTAEPLDKLSAITLTMPITLSCDDQSIRYVIHQDFMRADCSDLTDVL